MHAVHETTTAGSSAPVAPIANEAPSPAAVAPSTSGSTTEDDDILQRLIDECDFVLDDDKLTPPATNILLDNELVNAALLEPPSVAHEITVGDTWEQTVDEDLFDLLN